MILPGKGKPKIWKEEPEMIELWQSKKSRGKRVFHQMATGESEIEVR